MQRTLQDKVQNNERENRTLSHYFTAADQLPCNFC